MGEEGEERGGGGKCSHNGVNKKRERERCGVWICHYSTTTEMSASPPHPPSPNLVLLFLLLLLIPWTEKKNASWVKMGKWQVGYDATVSLLHLCGLLIKPMMGFLSSRLQTWQQAEEVFALYFFQCRPSGQVERKFMPCSCPGIIFPWFHSSILQMLYMSHHH